MDFRDEMQGRPIVPVRSDRRRDAGPRLPPRWKHLLYAMFAAVLLPLWALAAVEWGLRVAGLGHPAAFTVPCTSNGRDAVCDNPSFTWTFFPRDVARSPVSFAFPDGHGDDVFRVFVVGGSAAQGDPEPAFGSARILETLLRERYPGMRFEVINAGVTAINSHVVLPLVRDLGRHDPDLFIVYLGHNEVVGPYGAGTVFSPLSSNLPLIRAGIRLRSTRLGQFLSGLARARGEGEWRGMEMFLEQRVGHDDPRLVTLYEHFRRNLEDIVRAARRSGARVVVSTAAANLGACAPFASLHREGLGQGALEDWERHVGEGVAREAAGDADGALERYRRAERIDDRFAELQYRIARVHRARGDAEEALARFRRALDLDALRFRADRRINEIIRAVAAGRVAGGVHLVDAERLLGARSPGGILGAELFDDHVHLNFAGNHALALALLREIETFLPATLGEPPPGDPPLDLLTCARRLAHTGFDRHRQVSTMLDRLRRAPFTGQADHGEQVRRLEAELERLGRFASAAGYAEADAVYRGAIAGAPHDPWLRYNRAELLAAGGDHAGAARELVEFRRHLPRDVPGHEKLSTALAAAGRFAEAISECRALHERAPDFAPPYYTRAYALASLGRLDESIGVYRELLEIDPASAAWIHNEIGRIETHRGRFAEAERSFSEAILHDERSGDGQLPDAHYNLGIALERAGKLDEAQAAFRRARDQYRAALRNHPDSPVLRAALENTLVKLN